MSFLPSLQMDRSMGGTGWMEKMRREQTNFFLSLLSLASSCSLLCTLTQIRTHTPYLTVTYFLFLLIFSNLPHHFTPWLVQEGEGVTGIDASATYLVPLFTFIYPQTFQPLPSSSTSTLLFCNRTMSNLT
jgi:hypothetical protein